MVRYIDKAGVISALNAQDWPAFARGYNGPGYAKNGYDRKLAAAYRRHAGGAGTTDAGTVLKAGSKGEAVRELQQHLAALGYGIAADGLFGPATQAALRRFQKENGLVADGIAGPKTLTALKTAIARPRPGWWSAIKAGFFRLFGLS